MAVDFETSDPVDLNPRESNFVKVKGTYHFVCHKTEENPKGHNGAFIPNSLVRFHLTVLAGTDMTQKGKYYEFTIFTPDVSKKDQGALGRRINTRTQVAFNAFAPKDSGGRKSFDPATALHQQIILDIEPREDKPDYMQVKFDRIWHVDDPTAATFPKDAEAIKLLPPAMRKPPEWFALPASPQQSGVNNQATAPNTPAVDLSNL